jgi:hypothetical protein
MAMLDPAITLVAEAAVGPVKVALDARGGGSPHLLKALSADVKAIHGDTGVTLVPTGPTIGGCSVGGPPRTSLTPMPAGR